MLSVLVTVPRRVSDFCFLLFFVVCFLHMLYLVCFLLQQSHIVSAGYDTTVRLYDIEKQVLVRKLTSHTGPVCCTAFNPHGNLIVSG
jgi:WD40 repeat protein